MPIQIASQLIPRNGNTWPVAEDIHIKGGYRVLSTLVDRDAVDATTLKVGTKVYVVEDQTEYRVASLDPITWVVVPAGGGTGGGVDADFLVDSRMFPVTSRYHASRIVNQEVHAISSSIIVGWNLNYTRSGASCTIEHPGHSRSVGEVVIAVDQLGNQHDGTITAVTGTDFTFECKNAGPTSGICYYSMGIGWRNYKADTVTLATGANDIRGGRPVFPVGIKVMVSSLRIRMGVNTRENTTYWLDLAGTHENGFGDNNSYTDVVIPVVTCRTEGSGSPGGLTANATTLSLNQDGIFSRFISSGLANVAGSVQYHLSW